MSCDKCGSKKAMLCPASFGLALGVTCGLAVFICSTWMIYYGMPQMMTTLGMETPTWGSSTVHALWALLKGFIFGFVLAAIYDGIICCCKCFSCRKSGCACRCGCVGTCTCPPTCGCKSGSGMSK